MERERISSSFRVQVKIMMSHDPEGHLVIQIFFPSQAEAMMVAINEMAMGTWISWKVLHFDRAHSAHL